MVRLYFLSYLILRHGFLHTLASGWGEPTHTLVPCWIHLLNKCMGWFAQIWHHGPLFGFYSIGLFISPCTFLWQMLPPLYKAQCLNTFSAAKTTLTGMSTDSSPVCRSCYLISLTSCQSSHGGSDFPLIMLSLAKNIIL